MVVNQCINMVIGSLAELGPSQNYNWKSAIQVRGKNYSLLLSFKVQLSQIDLLLIGKESSLCLKTTKWSDAQVCTK